MSLFDETVARANRAEKALDDAQRRIIELENEVKAVKRDRALGQYHPSKTAKPPSFSYALTPEETEQMFKAKDYYDGQDKVAKGVRSRLLAPIAALFRRTP